MDARKTHARSKMDVIGYRGINQIASRKQSISLSLTYFFTVIKFGSKIRWWIKMSTYIQYAPSVIDNFFRNTQSLMFCPPFGISALCGDGKSHQMRAEDAKWMYSRITLYLHCKLHTNAFASIPPITHGLEIWKEHQNAVFSFCTKLGADIRFSSLLFLPKATENFSRGASLCRSSNSGVAHLDACFSQMLRVGCRNFDDWIQTSSDSST